MSARTPSSRKRCSRSTGSSCRSRRIMTRWRRTCSCAPSIRATSNRHRRPPTDGLTLRAFRDGTPYSGEDLFVADTPDLTARCTRDGKTPGMCLSERRIDGADLTFRFPRNWLAQWRDVANAMDRLTVQLHGPADEGGRPRRLINVTMWRATAERPQPCSTRSSSRIAIWNWNERSSSSSSTNSTPMNSSPI